MPGAAGASGAPALEMHEQERDRGRGDAGYARRLPEGGGAVGGELLPRLHRQAVDIVVIEVLRQGGLLVAPAALDLLALALDVARVLGLDLELLRRLRVRDPAAGQVRELGVRHAGAEEQLEQAPRARRPARAAGRPWGRSEVGASRARSRSIVARLSWKRRQRTSSTSPRRRPVSVRRRSALSSRSERRYSAREVNMR